jgi:hypothetical protein
MPDLVAQPHQRVELLVDHALLHRDDRVVGDLDALGADLGAALGDVAHADAGGPWASSRRSWVSSGCMSSSAYARKNRGPGEGRLVLLVVTYDVAGVLAEEALDALAELLPALDVDLRHPALAVRRRAGGLERRELGWPSRSCTRRR